MKNKLLFSFLFVLASFISYGQTTDSLPSVLNPEKKAAFTDGMNGWIKFLERNLDRDLMFRVHAPKGAYRVTGNFLVDTLGHVSDIRIETDPGYGTAAEFKRVIKLSSGRWIPAYDKGKAVPFRHQQSITLMND
jgi:protein TonB